MLKGKIDILSNDGIAPINSASVVSPNANPLLEYSVLEAIIKVIGIVILNNNIPSIPSIGDLKARPKHIALNTSDIVATLLSPNLSPSIPPSIFPSTTPHTNNIDRANCLYIGDTNVDKESATNVGLPYLLVNYGYRTKEELEKMCPNDTTLSSANELYNQLLKWVNL